MSMYPYPFSIVYVCPAAIAHKLLVTAARISSGPGIEHNAPFLVTTMDAAAFANKSISRISSTVRASVPNSRIRLNTAPQKVSPAPVVSTTCS